MNLKRSIGSKTRRKRDHLSQWLLEGSRRACEIVTFLARPLVGTTPRRRSTARRLGRDTLGCFQHLEQRVVLTTIDLGGADGRPRQHHLR